MHDQVKEPYFIRLSTAEKWLFFLSIAGFIAAAVLGWIKLRYGFNFIDEGYHMTESWRLYAGDHLTKDNLTDTLTLYTVFNSIVFFMNPVITLLGFREIQYCLNIFALAVFGLALSRSSGQYLYIPFVLSLFAFTGLDADGLFSNLNYYTYSHLFLTLYVGFIILGLYSESSIGKRLFWVAAGLSLWAMSFTALYLSVVAVSPVLSYLVFKRVKGSHKQDIRDLAYILSPFIIIWLFFLIIYNRAYVESVFSFAGLMVKVHWTLDSVNWEAIKHIGVSGLFLFMVYVYYKKLDTVLFIILSILTSVLMYFVIDTSFFTIIPPYYDGWFSKPMWFLSLLVGFLLVYWPLTLRKIYSGQGLSREEEIGFIIMVPSTIQSIIGSILSTNGILLVAYSAIPITGAFALLVISFLKARSTYRPIQSLILPIMLLPFYFSTALADWKFTFFDVEPRHASVMINEGFGKGIYTNSYYNALYKWIYDTSSQYSKDDDYIISYVVSPMVYMISQRKPALDHSYTCFKSRTPEFNKRSVERMEEKKRNPKLVYIFEDFPALRKPSYEDDEYVWFGKQFTFPSDDPISTYVQKNMYFLDKLVISDDISVICYINNPVDPAILRLKRAVKSNPKNAELYAKLGDLYLKKSDYLSAGDAYRKYVGLNPDSIDGLNQLARIYAQMDRPDDAIVIFQKIVEIKPDKADAFYNLACMYSRVHKEDESLQALKKAISLGFDDCELIIKDADLSNIRASHGFKELIKGRCPN